MEKHSIDPYSGFNLLYLDPIPIFLVGDVALEDVKNVLLAGKLLPPHCTQLVRLVAALQVKQVIIPKLSKGRGGRVSPAAIGEIIPLLCAVDVTFWPHGPEYWPDVLSVAFVVGRGLPGKGFEGDRVFTPHSQSLQDLDHSNLTVQSIEMDALDLVVKRKWTL